MLRMVIVFVAGLSLGVLATSHVWIVLGRLDRENMRVEYLLEQHLLAGRARRSGDTLRHALHAMNVADAECELGFRWLQRWRSEGYWERFRTPWLLFPIIRPGPQLEVGGAEDARRSLEARYRAQAALALEPLGAAHAEAQWKAAAELEPDWSREQLRTAAERGSYESEDYEAALLDSKTHEELEAAIDRMARPMGVTPEDPSGYR